jgi:hypothetical protein
VSPAPLKPLEIGVFLGLEINNNHWRLLFNIYSSVEMIVVNRAKGESPYKTTRIAWRTSLPHTGKMEGRDRKVSASAEVLLSLDES